MHPQGAGSAQPTPLWDLQDPITRLGRDRGVREEKERGGGEGEGGGDRGERGRTQRRRGRGGRRRRREGEETGERGRRQEKGGGDRREGGDGAGEGERGRRQRRGGQEKEKGTRNYFQTFRNSVEQRRLTELYDCQRIVKPINAITPNKKNSSLKN